MPCPSSLVFGAAGSDVKLVVRRKTGTVPSQGPVRLRGTVPALPDITLTLKRTVTRQARVAHSASRRQSGGCRLLDQNIGYMDLARLPSLGQFERAFAALHQADGLIIDIRGYPGFTVQLALSARLIDQPIKSAVYEIPIVSGYDREEQV